MNLYLYLHLFHKLWVVTERVRKNKVPNVCTMMGYILGSAAVPKNSEEIAEVAWAIYNDSTSADISTRFHSHSCTTEHRPCNRSRTH